MIQLNLPRGSPVIEIKVHSDNRTEAATVANEIAAVYLKATPSAALVQRAEPGLKPVRPNKRLNITLGLVVGGSLLIVGIGLLVAFRIAANKH